MNEKIYFIKGEINKEKFGFSLLFLGIIYLLIMTYIGFSKPAIWNPEIFSLGLATLPLNEFLDLGIRDFHPLLYYFILKVFIKFFALFNITDLVLIGKIVSLTPFYLLLILSFTKIKENFGILTCGIFTLCINSMPQLMFYGVEIRMYGWGLLFVTASLVYMYEILKNNSWKNWAIFTLLTIFSAHTHYFSGIASFSLYLTLLVYILLKNREMLKKWIVSTIIAILGFIPWLFILLSQVSSVQQGYWILPITLERAIGFIWFVFTPEQISAIRGDEIMPASILGFLLLSSLVILIYYYIKDKKELKNNYAIMGIIAFVLVPIIGITISTLNEPIIAPRYLIPSFGCLWLGFSILLSKAYEKKAIFIPILILVLIVGMVSTSYFIDVEETNFKDTQEKTMMLQDAIGSGNIVFHDTFNIYFETSNYFLKDNHHLSWNEDIGTNIKNALADPGIQGEIEGGSRVFFIDGGKTNYQDLIDAGLELKKIDSKAFPGDVNRYEIYEIII